MMKLSFYLKPYWKAALLAPFLMLVEVFMDLLQPKLIASIINDGVLKYDLLHIRNVGALMVGAAIIGLLGGIGCIVFSSKAAYGFGADLRSDLFDKVQSFSFRNLDKFKAGSLVTRLTNDVVQVQNVVMAMLRILIRAPFLAIGSFIMALTISPKLALILVVIIPLLSAALLIVIRKAFPLFIEVQQKIDSLNTVLQESLSGIRVIKAFVRADYEERRFGKENDELMYITVKASRLIALIIPIMMLLMNVTVVAIIWFGGLQVWEGAIEIGDIVALINYITQILFSLMMVGMMLMFVSRAKASAERINEVLETEPEINNIDNAKKDAVKSGKVVFDNVSFSYDNSENSLVLKDINFTAEPGQIVAILGATGSGKSSLINLIPRLYDTTKGRVLVDGTDVREIGLHTLRSNIGIVLQETILFSGTVKHNVSFGRSPQATQTEIEGACIAAQAHDFIMEMPNGYETELGQRGVNLSGGQKQRLAIARALLIKPRILILDDSTSALDFATESKLQEALKEVMRESTVFVIAQRISSVTEADKILVLDEGRIAAEGTHKELIKSSPIYQEIYRSQLRKEDGFIWQTKEVTAGE